MNRFALTAAWLLAALAAPAHAASQPPLRAAGNPQAAWILRQTPAIRAFDVLAKPAGQKWKWVVQHLPGEPLAAVPLHEQLHVLLRTGDYLIFDLAGDVPSPGLRPNHPKWGPATGPASNANLAALCPASQLGSLPGQTIVALTRYLPSPPESISSRPSAASAPTTAPAPAPAPATAPAPAGRALALFCLQGGRWTWLEDVPGLLVSDDETVLAAVLDARLCLLVHSPATGARLLVRDAKGLWQTPTPLPLPAGQNPLALTEVSGSLVLALVQRADKTARVSLLVLDKALKPAAPAAVVSETPITPPVQVFAYADALAILWQSSPLPTFAPCETTGRIKTTEPLDILGAPPTDKQAEELWRMILLGLGAAFGVALLLRLRLRPIPASLPARMRPAPLGRRLIAFLIDLAPFTFLSFSFFPVQVPDQSPANSNDLMKFAQGSTDLALFVACLMLTHAAYCFLMESRFGATLGKRAMGLRVVSIDGGPISPQQVLCRTLVRMVEIGPPMVTLVTLLLVTLTQYRQRIGDLLAQTTVVEVLPESSRPPIPPPPQD